MASFFNFGGDEGDIMDDEPVVEETTYQVPKERANGRPHDLGWLDSLKSDSVEKKDRMIMGQIPSGRIITED